MTHMDATADRKAELHEEHAFNAFQVDPVKESTAMTDILLL
jgi:hypothetical protein